MLTVQPIVINLCGDWASATIDLLLLVVTVLSVVCAFFAYGHQKKRNKKDTACALAKHYAESIINKYSDIVNVFIKTGVADDIKKLVDLADINDFNKDEIYRLTTNNAEKRNQIVDRLQNIDPQAILEMRMKRDCSATDRDIVYSYYTHSDENGNVSIRNGRFLQDEFSQEIVSLLNELEWFAMNCHYRLADEELLYQSLHQTYLSTVWLLYFHISAQNTNNEDKVYTNVAWLFVEWRDRLLKITKKAEKRKQKYLKKANAVETPIYSGKAL